MQPSSQTMPGFLSACADFYRLRPEILLAMLRSNDPEQRAAFVRMEFDYRQSVSFHTTFRINPTKFGGFTVRDVLRAVPIIRQIMGAPQLAAIDAVALTYRNGRVVPTDQASEDQADKAGDRKKRRQRRRWPFVLNRLRWRRALVSFVWRNPRIVRAFGVWCLIAAWVCGTYLIVHH